jgi:capsular polysaccharide biosynthesis protein
MYENAGGSFHKQMELMATHGIFIAPHGAGLMNILYMPAQAAVVELFPYTLDHNLYAALAVLMGVANYPVHATAGHTVWATDHVRPKLAAIAPLMH